MTTNEARGVRMIGDVVSRVRKKKKPGPRPLPLRKRRLMRETLLIDEKYRQALDYLHAKVDSELRAQVEEGKCVFTGQYVKESSNPDDVQLSRSTLLVWMLAPILSKVALEAKISLEEASSMLPPEGFKSKYF